MVYQQIALLKNDILKSALENIVDERSKATKENKK